MTTISFKYIIKYNKVKVIRDETGLAIDYEVEGDYPKYGNDDPKVDYIAVEIVEKISEELKKQGITDVHIYNDAEEIVLDEIIQQ